MRQLQEIASELYCWYDDRLKLLEWIQCIQLADSFILLLQKWEPRCSVIVIYLLNACSQQLHRGPHIYTNKWYIQNSSLNKFLAYIFTLSSCPHCIHIFSGCSTLKRRVKWIKDLCSELEQGPQIFNLQQLMLIKYGRCNNFIKIILTNRNCWIVQA